MKLKSSHISPLQGTHLALVESISIGDGLSAPQHIFGAIRKESECSRGVGNSLSKFLITAILLLFCLSLSKNAAAQHQSLYNDIRAHQVGDVITVVLTENISGSSSTNASTSSNTAGSAESGINGNFVPFQPTFGADAQVTYDSDERIRADQQQLLQGTLSVRIKEVADNGDFVIAGQRSTEINGERHEMSVQGFVRPSDITQSNRVLSYRIADAQIKYLKEEGVGEMKRKTGIGRKILWGALGVVTAVAAFMAGGG